MTHHPAPSSASRTHVARPMPVPAPVTSATLPSTRLLTAFAACVDRRDRRRFPVRVPEARPSARRRRRRSSRSCRSRRRRVERRHRCVSSAPRGSRAGCASGASSTGSRPRRSLGWRSGHPAGGDRVHPHAVGPGRRRWSRRLRDRALRDVVRDLVLLPYEGCRQAVRDCAAASAAIASAAARPIRYMPRTLTCSGGRGARPGE